MPSVKEDIIDYALPLIKVERMTRKIHDLCLDEKYLVANDLCLEMIVELRKLTATLIIMNEKKK